MKKLFNRHKLRRRWRRKKRESLRGPQQKGSVVSSRKYTGANPYVAPCSASHIKKRAEVFALTSILAILAGVFIYHPFFHIQRVSVSGLQRIEEAEFLQTVRGAMTYKKLGFLPAQSYLFVSPKAIQQILLDKYPIDSISVTKSFPQTLTVAIEEKISTIIFDNGNQYSYLDVEGNLVEVLREVGDDEWQTETEVTTTTLADGTVGTEELIVSRTHTVPVDLLHAEMGPYPIVFDKTQRELGTDGSVVDRRIVQNTIGWFTLLNRETDIPFSYVELDDVERHAMVYTREGWGIKVNIHEDPALQFEKLQNVLTKVNRNAISYIDVRFPERVYWQ